MRIEDLRLKPYARLAAFGALGVSAATLGLFVFLVFFTRSTPLGGIDETQALLSWISLAVPFALIIAVHLAYARILMRYSKEQGLGTRD